MISELKLDPRTKLTVVLVLSTYALIYNSIKALGVICICSAVIAIAMNSKLVPILFRIKKVLAAMVAIAIVQSVFIKTGDPLLSINNIIFLTDYGLIKSLEFILRIAIIIVSAAIITTSTSREIIQGLVQWYCPYEIAFMASVAIRFLPIFKDEITDMVTAIQLRGINLKKVKINDKLKIYRYMLVPIVINTVLKAKELSAAMEMRGFKAYAQRTSYKSLKMKKIDVLIISISVASLIIITFRGEI